MKEKMVNKCKYCGKEWIETSSGGFEVCKCKKAQIEWSICIRIQSLKKQLNQLNKELSDLDDKKKNKSKCSN